MNISSYDILLQKLDEFIRKYYKNQLIRGSLLTAALLLLLFLTVSVLEYFGHFTSPVRTFIFYAFLTSSIFILSKYIAIPLFKLFKLGRIITHTEAAEVIGRHFPEVKDKLLNTLQLKEMYDGQLTDASLIKAGIDQKISALRPIPFDKAINLGKNRKYIKYVAVPLMLILLIIISSPGVIMDSTARLVNFNKYYELHAPFTFIIDNDSLSAIQQEDYTLKLSVAGSVLPDAVYIHTDNNDYR
ncbi:MAG: hypothetical protein ACE5DN_07800, partial [Flavobacteriales bacterium]